ncbi:MAG: hypothetical protein HY023_15775, partial [Chloroflexi bacterium]|nr:hypothetical protein [Chloroflexota bacterium]
MSRLASILVLLMMLPMILAVTAAPASAQSGEPTCENTEDEIQRRLRQRLEEEEQVRPQEQTQTTWPTRRTGVLEFLNFSDQEYTLSIGGALQSLHAGHRLYPNKTWIELPAGTYEYDLLSDNGVIHGQTRVFETLTWPVPIGDYYQEPTPPPPSGPYA